MKKVLIIMTITVGLMASSCKKYLDINTNPNSLTTASVNLVLPLAIVNTASLVSSMNDYGSQTVGYAANAGGFGGFGASWTYNYGPSQGEGIWDFGYSILENFQYIINASIGSDANSYYDASSKIMKAFIYQALVDEFNNIPYNQALKGDTLLKPKYDSASVIYPQLASLLDSAILEINNAQSPLALGSADPLFQGNMVGWKQFANTLKLRLIIRASAATQFANKTFSSDGFLADDAIVNPGYKLATGQVNPSWGTWVADYTGARVGTAWIPATYVFGYYDGHKLLDTCRGKVIYYNFPGTPYNQLGVSPPNNTLTAPSAGGAWYSGGGATGTAWGNADGVMKGPDMGEPLILLTESDFLRAEADLRGILTQNAETDFNNGILASFTYLYKLPSNSVDPNKDPVQDDSIYMADNAANYLVNYSLATTTAEQTEAIITQKYIALNFINGEEAWSEYRRTGYPKTSSTTLNNPYGSFASIQSQATRPDHLPTRLPYPGSEASTNGSNVSQNVSVYTSTIFWAH